MSKRENLTEMIQAGKVDDALTLINSEKDYHEGESIVLAVLRCEESTQELIDAVFEMFLNTRENRFEQHGYWVHSLSHFTKILWKKGMIDWIKKFNEVAFRGAFELNDDNCSDRLVRDFVKFANWDDDPATYGLTPDSLSWVNSDSDRMRGVMSRINASPFESEEEYLRWTMRQSDTLTAFDFNAQMDLVNSKDIRYIIQQLKDLGADTAEYDALEKELLTKQLSDLTTQSTDDVPDWKVERIQKAIQITKDALAEMS